MARDSGSDSDSSDPKIAFSHSSAEEGHKISAPTSPVSSVDSPIESSLIRGPDSASNESRFDEKYPPRTRSILPSSHPSTSSRRPKWTLKSIFGFDLQHVELRNTSWLDGLRGLAALEVFIFHYLDGWAEHHRGWGQDGVKDKQWWRLPFIRSIYGSGDTAVCVFFAISGYVLTYKTLSLLRQNRRQDLYASVASAMFRRGIRLYLPVIVESFVLMLLARAGLPKASVYEDAPTMLLELKRWFWSIIHLLMPLRYPDRWTEVLNHYDGTISWTIPLEYYGSMVVYSTSLLFTRTRNYNVRRVLYTAFITTSFLRDDWIGAQFLLGMAFADYQLQNETLKFDLTPRTRRYRGLFFLCAFVFGIYLSGLPVGSLSPTDQTKLLSRPFYNWISQPLASIGAYVDRKADRYLTCLAGIAIVVGVGETGRLKRLMETSFVQYLGKISFGLYLCHIFLHAYLRPLDTFYFSIVGLSPATAREVGGIRYLLAFCMMMAVSVVVNFAAGSLFEKHLDRPSVKIAKAVEQWCLDQD